MATMIVEYKVYLPDRGTKEFEAIVASWFDDGGLEEYKNYSPNPGFTEEEAIVDKNAWVEDQLIPYLVIKSQGGDFTEYVQIVDDQVDW